jgi:hypothetical protein
LRGVTKENKEITVTVNHTKLNPISIIMLLNADI